MTESYTAPTLNADAFHCPHCNVYAHQYWADPNVMFQAMPVRNLDGVRVSYCRRCDNFAIWLVGRMIHPSESTAPMPSTDMPDDVRADYTEARDILIRSPRS